MATRGKPIPATTIAQIRKLREQQASLRKTEKQAGVSRNTVIKYSRKSPVS